MQKLNGAECPACGCRDSQVVRRRIGWATGVDHPRRASRWRCNHCATLFNAEDPESADAEQSDPATYTAVYQPSRCACPYCQSLETRVTSSPGGGRRRHKCESCEMPFDSVEGAN